ncbi:hypothetical protein [Pseudorhodoplanes sp.]|jgi:hypothetical protein|uniref:hypothetical protein n=1 Tax=Pseudorhodoplanes sp. TaxID=1934341 RepID=UPI002C34FB9C|nr:hypothetical protein [Pseudorhodoplanes sp.]HWV43405.1 hypothetical protein [Pseudorhodoplanes sp.]
MADFLRELECAARQSNSGYLIGGVLAGAVIAFPLCNAWKLELYASRFCAVVCMALGLMAGILLLTLIHDACAM